METVCAKSRNLFFTAASCKEQQKTPGFQNSSVCYLCGVWYCCHAQTGIVSPSFFSSFLYVSSELDNQKYVTHFKM